MTPLVDIAEEARPPSTRGALVYHCMTPDITDGQRRSSTNQQLTMKVEGHHSRKRKEDNCRYRETAMHVSCWSNRKITVTTSALIYVIIYNKRSKRGSCGWRMVRIPTRL